VVLANSAARRELLARVAWPHTDHAQAYDTATDAASSRPASTASSEDRFAVAGLQAGYALTVRNQDDRERLPREFFDRPSTEVAPDLLGCVLWHDSPAGLVAARLVEVEAYRGPIDPASHAYRGKTARNAVMFGPPGYAYVYFSYGMHYCVNLVCQPAGQGEAVLIRAGAVVEGADLARRRRYGLPDAAADRKAAAAAGTGTNGRQRERDLARGPGRLCQALGIDRSLDGADACAPDGSVGVSPPVAFSQPEVSASGSIQAGPRVGISHAADRPWRYWLADDRYVSAYKTLRPRAPEPKPVSGRLTEDGTMHG
jgi:DNA-3-methyladenine glycosylase